MIEIKKIAALARLNLTEKESQSYQKDIESILSAFNRLAEINTNGVEPLVTMAEKESHLREDRVDIWKDSEKAFSQAPELVGKLFKVPPVV